MAKTLSSCFLQEPACTTHLHHSNRPSCTACGSRKRLSSENPSPIPHTKPKKPNNGPHPHFLRGRCYVPTLPPVLEEPPLSPQPIECYPMPSPTNKFSCSSDSPHREWLRKMRDCMREMIRNCDKILGDDAGDIDEETNNNAVNSLCLKYDTMDNCGDEYVETVSVEKKGEALILHFKCPCGNGYQIILFGGNCYYKLM